MSNTKDIVEPIVTEVYGTGSMVTAMIKDLVERIDAWTPKHDQDCRETFIFRVIWNWFSGGDTADAAAIRINKALS